MTHFSSPTRRSLIKAGAWTAPAIVLATAAPAFATSGSPALSLEPGGSVVVEKFGLAALRFKDLTITVGQEVSAGELTMAVTNPGRSLMELGTPEGWALAESATDRLVYARSAAARAGQVVAVANGTYVNDDGRRGSFEVAFAAPGHDSVRANFPISG